MAANLKSKRYYANARNQSQLIKTIAGMFIITVLFALLLKNKFVKTLLLCASLAYPVVIIVGILEVRPKSNFLELNEDGFVITRLGIKRKPIKWSSVGYVEKTGFMGADGVGIKYNSFENHNRLLLEFSRWNFGYDEVVINFYDVTGNPFSDDAKEYFTKWAKSHKQEIATPQKGKSKSDWKLP